MDEFHADCIFVSTIFVLAKCAEIKGVTNESSGEMHHMCVDPRGEVSKLLMCVRVLCSWALRLKKWITSRRRKTDGKKRRKRNNYGAQAGQAPPRRSKKPSVEGTSH